MEYLARADVGVVLHTAGGGSDPTFLISINVDDVTLSTLTISHRTTAYTSVEAAVVVSGPGFPATRVSNFNCDNCLVEYIKHGLVIRGNNWRVTGSNISYIGPNGRTRRAIFSYAANGTCFIKKIHLQIMLQPEIYELFICLQSVLRMTYIKVS